jgi:hypothetical protein
MIIPANIGRSIVQALLGAAVCWPFWPAAAHADPFGKLLDSLVEQGAITRTQADAAMQAIHTEQQTQGQAPASAPAQEPKPPAADEVPPGTVRVPYVPEFIREEIRQEVRDDLHQQVVADVMQQARIEGWGTPGSLPSWLSTIKVRGDMRLRSEGDYFANGNIAPPPTGYVDFLKVNQAGGFGKTDNPFLNTSVDRERLRVRARLGVEARPAEGVLAGFRLSTGNPSIPVSTNQTLGNSLNRYSVQWDEVFLRYQANDAGGEPWLTVSGGRIANPWFSTDLVWAPDLGFEGVAARLSTRLPGSTTAPRRWYLTAGAFPVQEIELSSHDKWLYGAQLGVDLGAAGGSSLRVAAAYYYFANTTGQRNTLNSTVFDYTAPGFMQKGNLLYDIRNDTDPATSLWALAAAYHEVNVTAQYDLAMTGSLHSILTADFVKNIGYDEDSILARTGGAVARSQGFRSGSDPIGARTVGYQIKLAVGRPAVRARGDWQAYGGFKHLERDAVLDAYTDPDFHLGGTDAEGWFIGADYGLLKDTWLGARWISADSIDGAPMGVDVLQIDVNARF